MKPKEILENKLKEAEIRTEDTENILRFASSLPFRKLLLFVESVDSASIEEIKDAINDSRKIETKSHV
jgi:hypothetical protein